jgi:hypothetical protein
MKCEPCLGGFIILLIKEELELTYKQLEFLGPSKETFRNWVNGYTRPSFDDIEMILDFYNKDISLYTQKAKDKRSMYKKEAQNELETS